MTYVPLTTSWDQVWGTVTTLLGRTSVQAGYLVSAVVLVAATLLLGQRARWPVGRTLLGVAAALALALFPALTLARRGVDLRRHPVCDLSWSLVPTTAEQVLNLALLLPAAFFAAWALRSAWLVVLVGVALSLGAEGTQAVLDIGDCQAGDVVLNTAGALVGAIVGAVLGRLSPAGRDRPGSA